MKNVVRRRGNVREASRTLGLSQAVVADVVSPGGMIQPMTLERVLSALAMFELGNGES